MWDKLFKIERNESKQKIKKSFRTFKCTHCAANKVAG